MKKIIISFILILATSIGLVNAQKGYISFQYAPSFSTSNLNEYISEPSIRGFQFEYKKAINENIFIGVDAGWNYFNERKDHDVYTFDNVAISGVQYRKSISVPVLFAIDYRFKLESKFSPYVNFGLGTMYTTRTTDMGILRANIDVWQFVIKPEVGFMYELFPKGALKFSAKYYNGFEADNIKGQTYFSLGFGYVILL